MERVARDEATGKRYYIPDDMNYQEYNTFVCDGDKSGFDVIDKDGVVHYVRKKGLTEGADGGKITNMKVQDVTKEYMKRASQGKGVLPYAKGYKKGNHENEVRVGKWLCNTFGGTIVLLKESNRHKVSTPDYLWEGKAWELKTVSTIKAVDSALRKAVKQISDNPGGIILELISDLDVGDLEEAIKSRFKRIRLDELDILIVNQNNVIEILRCKK